MVVSNANEAKLYCIWIYNIERFIFSDGVLLPFGKQSFFSVFVLTPTLPQLIFPLFCFVLVLTQEHMMASHTQAFNLYSYTLTFLETVFC